MREINFRAWNKKTQTMILPPGPCDSNPGPIMTFDGRTYINGVYQDLIYMQWTGLITQEAEYIYEGDILGGIYGNGTVEYCDVCKSFQYHAMGTCFACEGEVHWGELVADDGKLEVVGNKWENPERLEENL